MSLVEVVDPFELYDDPYIVHLLKYCSESVE